MRKSVHRCPLCGAELVITSLKCPSCGTEIRGEFQMCEFCRLNESQLDFLRVFIASKGNLSLVSRKLGISHPTARARLNAIIKELGYEPYQQDETERTGINEILEMVERGELTAEEAAELIKGIKSNAGGGI